MCRWLGVSEVGEIGVSSSSSSSSSSGVPIGINMSVREATALMLLQKRLYELRGSLISFCGSWLVAVLGVVVASSGLRCTEG